MTPAAEEPREPARDQIAQRAYLIALGQQEGGNAVENWLRAERELRNPQPQAPMTPPEELPDLVPDPMDRLPPSCDPVEPPQR